MYKEWYGCTRNGKDVYLYRIQNYKGMQVSLLNFGATIVDLWIPDRFGVPRDVSLGYENLLGYETGDAFFGATVGPNANRISDAKVCIDGVEYLLDANNYENNHHSGYHTLAKQLWEVKSQKEDEICFRVTNPHLAQRFPGNMECCVTYKVTDENQLEIRFDGVSDKTTVFNMTNHTYFNLNGSNAGNICNHMLWIEAKGYTPLRDEKSIPTGEVEDVTGTPFDFREEKAIGQDIETQHPQLLYAKGYDHNYTLSQADGIRKAATAYAKESGIRLTVYTDTPGLQFYTGNYLEGIVGKDGHRYNARDGFCLESQYYPNAVNEPKFQSPIYKAGQKYESKTIYEFTVE